MSQLPFELLLAVRYLRPKRTFVSVITLISVMGVMLGVAVLIIVISVMNGFDQQLREKVLGFNAHLMISGTHKLMRDYPKVISVVESNVNVKGAAPFIISQVLLRTQDKRSAAPYLRGADPKLEGTVSSLPTSIVDGNFDLRRHGLLLGTALAGDLGVSVGDRVSIYSTRDVEKIADAVNQTNSIEVAMPKEFEVRGIFDAGYYDYNANIMVTSLQDAQELLGMDDDNLVHDVSVALRDPFRAHQVAGQLQSALGDDYDVTTWMEQNPLMMAVTVEKNLMLYILFFIVIVAAFGITCTLITFVVMKTREIGLLKAIGASNQQVMLVFLGQSLIVSVSGVIAGFALGMLALAYRNEFLHLMRRVTGLELFPAKLYNFSELPSLVSPRDIVIICGGALICCVLAAAFPARYASRLNPVEALRHE